MVERLKNTFNSLNRERLAGNFYNAAKVVNAAAAGYVIMGKTGAVLSTAWFALNLIDVKKKHDSENGKISPYTMAEIGQDESFGQKIKEMKDEFGITEEMRIFVTARGPLQIAIGNPVHIEIPEDHLHMFSEDELIAMLKHELAHQIITSPYNQMTSMAGDKTTKYNMYLGAAASVLTLNPLPFAAGYLSRKGNHFIASRQDLYNENASDAFAVRHGGGKDLIAALQKFVYSNDRVVIKAMTQQIKHAAQIPGRVREFFTAHVPEFIQKMRMKADYYLHATHPRSQERLQNIAGLLREQEDPDFTHVPPQETQVLALCEGCMHQKTPEERARSLPYLREAFRETYGHENFEIEYFNCGREAQRPGRGMAMMVMVGGGDIIILSPGMGGDEGDWPFPFPDPRMAGDGEDPEPGKKSGTNEFYAGLG